MSYAPSFSRMRLTNSKTKQGSNSGICRTCGSSVSWRSVNDRCWHCEMDEIKTRRPLFVEREILKSAGKASDE